MAGRETLKLARARGCTIATDSSRQEHRRYWCSALSVLAITSASSVIAQAKVYETGYETSRSSRSSLHWIDNDRLLFTGMNTADMNAAIAKKEAKREERLKKLYLWDAKTNSVTLYADAKAVCVADGVVRYTVREDKAAGKVVERVGPLGSEKEIETLVSDEISSRTAQSVWVYSKHTCKTHLLRELVPPPEKGRRIIVLREGDGYIDAGPLDTKELRDQRIMPVRLFLPDRRSPVELPMKIEQGSGNPSYSTYLGAYVTRPRPKGSDPGHITDWPRGMPFTIYTFKSTGEVSESVLPYGEWATIYQVQPTRAGWIFSGQGVVRAKAGLFLFRNSAARRLDTGQVYEVTVSGDGCRAAVAIQNRNLEMGTPINLKVFDVCKGGE